MRRLPSSYNQDNISDAEIDEVFYGAIAQNTEVPLVQRDYGERVLYVGFTSQRAVLVEIGIEDQKGELVVFHAREATGNSIREYEAQTKHERLE